MKLGIGTKHLRIFNLIKFTNGENLIFLEKCLGISKANLNNYLKEIYDIIPNSEKIQKIDLVIKAILSTKNIYSLLKEKQAISKDERIFFLILKLLIEKNLNLSFIAQNINATRRTLNTDLNCIKKSLDVFDLKTNSLAGKGVFLEGDPIDIKRALCCYVYKYLVEEEYLPDIFKNNFSKFLKNDKINTVLNQDSEILLSRFNFDAFFYNRVLLKSFYYSFYHLNSCNISYNSSLENSLKVYSEFEIYFSKVFQKSEINNFYDYFHNSIFKNISIEEISYFINILKICSGNFPEENVFLNDHIAIWKSVILKSIEVKILDSHIEKLKNFILRIAFSGKQNHYLHVYELEFLNINIESKATKDCINLYNNLKEYYWNISFTDVLMLYFLIVSFEVPKKTSLFVVYKDIPRYILDSLKEKLESKHNVTILDFVNISNFENFKQNNIVKTVGVFKEFNFSDNNLRVVQLDLNF
ncbi:MAG: hypothetical protein ACRC6U_03670 [Fusobacteriaceae bacterium]